MENESNIHLLEHFLQGKASIQEVRFLLSHPGIG